VVELLDHLIVSPTQPLEVHPWIRHLRSSGLPPGLHSCLETLAGRNWPVAIQHGDFAPWNLLRRPDGVLGAIDWEYGTPEGFPHLDLAYYILQTSALIYRRNPLTAARYAAEYLTQQPALDLDSEEARALTRLTAYDAYLKGLEDGQSERADLQTWRRRIWQETICHV
jgi:aminoglycoside phosphotransferase (APT) family kinase protein